MLGFKHLWMFIWKIPKDCAVLSATEFFRWSNSFGGLTTAHFAWIHFESTEFIISILLFPIYFRNFKFTSEATTSQLTITFEFVNRSNSEIRHYWIRNHVWMFVLCNGILEKFYFFACFSYSFNMKMQLNIFLRCTLFSGITLQHS